MDKRTTLLLTYVSIHIALIALFVFDEAVSRVLEILFSALEINTGGTQIGSVAIALVVILFALLSFGVVILLQLKKVLRKVWVILLSIEYEVFVFTFLSYIF